MIRNLPIREIQTPAGTRYIFGPRTYRTLAEAQEVQRQHEAEFDVHIAAYRAEGERQRAEILAEMLADDPTLTPATITPEMRMRHIQRRGYRNVLRVAGGDRQRAAALYRGQVDDEK